MVGSAVWDSPNILKGFRCTYNPLDDWNMFSWPGGYGTSGWMNYATLTYYCEQSWGEIDENWSLETDSENEVYTIIIK